MNDVSVPAGATSKRAELTPFQALQVVQAALLTIQAGRGLSEAGRSRTFDALAVVARAVAA